MDTITTVIPHIFTTVEMPQYVPNDWVHLIGMYQNTLSIQIITLKLPQKLVRSQSIVFMMAQEKKQKLYTQFNQKFYSKYIDTTVCHLLKTSKNNYNHEIG